MKTVAVIDDNDSERLVVRDLVAECGLKVVAEGCNGAEAISICRNNSPDIVIMDVRMPVMNGIEAAEEISRTCPTPIVLLTADYDPVTIKRAVAAGAMAYLVKPVRIEDILPVVELATSRFKEFRELTEEVSDLKDALKSRKLVEKAKGLLMEKEGLTEAEAYKRIRRISMDRRKSMTEISSIIILALEENGGTEGG
jgi:response regulator NasT